MAKYRPYRAEPIEVAATVPSNIALLKYWGKMDEDHQWPANDSLSMTLDALHTRTLARPASTFQFVLEGKDISPDSNVGRKIFRHIKFLTGATGFTSPLCFTSQNTFPIGSGIASSASGLGALTLSALASWTASRSFVELEAAGFSRRAVADLARQGSGSSCRSLYPGFVLWEKGDSWQTQAVRSICDAKHWPLQHTVVLLTSEQKPVGSTQGHRLAWESPLFKIRLTGLPRKKAQLLDAIVRKNLEELGPILEEEALNMHAVMLTARKPLCYLTADCQEFLLALRAFREQTNTQAYFTLDAGSNVHIICETQACSPLRAWLKEKGHRYLCDALGKGPSLC